MKTIKLISADKKDTFNRLVNQMIQEGWNPKWESFRIGVNTYGDVWKFLVICEKEVSDGN